MSSDAFNTDSQPSASMGASVAIFLAGATVGAIAALLLAPQAGRESRISRIRRKPTRKSIRGGARDCNDPAAVTRGYGLASASESSAFATRTAIACESPRGCAG